MFFVVEAVLLEGGFSNVTTYPIVHKLPTMSSEVVAGFINTNPGMF